MAVLSTNTLNGSGQLTEDTPSCCTNRPGKIYMFVIRLMARDAAFLGRATGSARRTSGVNTALSYAFVNSPAGDATGVPLATPKNVEFLKQNEKTPFCETTRWRDVLDVQLSFRFDLAAHDRYRAAIILQSHHDQLTTGAVGLLANGYRRRRKSV